MSERIESFRDLIVYKKAFELQQDIFRLTKRFPKEELYGLTTQARRAAVSTPLNIAEGQSRKSLAENRNFLLIARGSLYEILAILEIVGRMKYMANQQKQTLRKEVFSLLRQINSLIKYLRK